MLRHRKSPLDAVRELDAFAKVPDTYKETSATGGTVSLVCMAAIVSLMYSEVRDFLYCSARFHFTPDGQLDSRMDLNVDITVAMPCRFIGADVLDSTGQSVVSFGRLEEENTWFELSPGQRGYFDAAQRLNRRLRRQSHSIQQLLWKSGYQRLFGDMPSRESFPDRVQDACRLHGRLQLTKVAGNFHVTAGKVLPLPMRAHAHLSMVADDAHFNYSHRIHRFAFEDDDAGHAGLVQPLEGDEVLTDRGSMLYQYFISAVPTEIESLASASSGLHGSLNTWQYSVRNQSRSIDHGHGSHGIPGIYFKYDVAPLRVRVVPDAPPIWRFLLRLCAIVGGVYASAGVAHTLLGALLRLAARWTSKSSPAA